MKKKYITPSTICFETATDCFLSLSIISGVNADPDKPALSKKPYSGFEDWGEDEEENENK